VRSKASERIATLACVHSPRRLAGSVANRLPPRLRHVAPSPDPDLARAAGGVGDPPVGDARLWRGACAQLTGPARRAAGAAAAGTEPVVADELLDER